jgi:hypothetical protein
MKAYQRQKLDYQQTIELFQFLVDTGLVWALRQDYVKKAEAMIAVGLIMHTSRDGCGCPPWA